MKGGGHEFKFNSLTNEVKGKLGTAGNKWRYVTPGLNMEGKCMNEKCDFYKKTNVIFQVGLGKKEIGKLTCKSECPGCKQKLRNVSNMIFSECKYSYEGTINMDPENEDAEHKEVKKSGETERDGYATFEKEGFKDLKNWIYLEVTCEKYWFNITNNKLL